MFCFHDYSTTEELSTFIECLVELGMCFWQILSLCGLYWHDNQFLDCNNRLTQDVVIIQLKNRMIRRSHAATGQTLGASYFFPDVYILTASLKSPHTMVQGVVLERWITDDVLRQKAFGVLSTSLICQGQCQLVVYTAGLLKKKSVLRLRWWIEVLGSFI